MTTDLGPKTLAWIAARMADHGVQAPATSDAAELWRVIRDAKELRGPLGPMHNPTPDRPLDLRAASTACYHVKAVSEGSAPWFTALVGELISVGALPLGAAALATQKPPRTLVVDWGCGTGSLLFGLLRSVTDPAAIDYVGIDNDATRVALARLVAEDIMTSAGVRLGSVDFDEGSANRWGLSRRPPAAATTHDPGRTVLHIFANAWRQTRGTAPIVDALMGGAHEALLAAKQFQATGPARHILVHALTTMSGSGKVTGDVAAAVMRRLARAVESENLVGRGRVLLPCPHPVSAWTTGCPRPPAADAADRRLLPSAAGDKRAFCYARCRPAGDAKRDFILVHTAWEQAPDEAGPLRVRPRQSHTELHGSRRTCRC